MTGYSPAPHTAGASAPTPPTEAFRHVGRRVALGTMALMLLAVAACGYGSQSVSEADTVDAGGGGLQLSADEVTIGYFASITHGTALVGLDDGGPIVDELGGTKLSTQVFNAGPSAIEALNAGALDLAFIGPNPAVNGFVQSGGENLKIVAGAASGGASLVVNPDSVENLDDLGGQRIATPQLGNTQDVALLNYLAEQGHEVAPESGEGDVTVLRIPNSEIAPAFESGSIDGAWLPEPSAADLVARGAETLLAEGELWENGQYVVTHLVASADFLEAHPDVVEAVVRGVVEANGWIAENPVEAREISNAEIEEQTGQPLPPEVIEPAFDNVEFLNDPLAGTLREGAEHAEAAGLLDSANLTGIYDLTHLNSVLEEEGLPPVTDDAGLGTD